MHHDSRARNAGVDSFGYDLGAWGLLRSLGGPWRGRSDAPSCGTSSGGGGSDVEVQEALGLVAAVSTSTALLLIGDAAGQVGSLGLMEGDSSFATTATSAGAAAGSGSVVAAASPSPPPPSPVSGAPSLWWPLAAMPLVASAPSLPLDCAALRAHAVAVKLHAFASAFAPSSSRSNSGGGDGMSEMSGLVEAAHSSRTTRRPSWRLSSPRQRHRQNFIGNFIGQLHRQLHRLETEQRHTGGRDVCGRLAAHSHPAPQPRGSASDRRD